MPARSRQRSERAFHTSHLVPDYAVKVSVVTFVGEALLIPWLIWMAIKGARSGSESPRGEVMERRHAQPTPAAS